MYEAGGSVLRQQRSDSLIHTPTRGLLGRARHYNKAGTYTKIDQEKKSLSETQPNHNKGRSSQQARGMETQRDNVAASAQDRRPLYMCVGGGGGAILKTKTCMGLRAACVCVHVICTIYEVDPNAA